MGAGDGERNDYLPGNWRWLWVLALTAIALTGCIALRLTNPGAEASSGVESPPPAKPSYWDSAIDFTANLPLVPNVTGELSGEIAFIQNTLVGPNRAGKERPLLVTDRGAYLLFSPADPDQKSLAVTIHSPRNGSLVLDLLPPEHGAHSDFNNMDGRPAVVYSKRAWNAVVPWTFMHPGISITVRNAAGQTGTLPAEAFEFGAPLELVTQNIELAMLTDLTNVPANQWSHPGTNRANELAIDYFQHAPVATFIAAQYLPIHLTKVVLPNGNVYTHRSSFEGAGVYRGDMRENIAKGLISTGINLANVGILATVGGDQNQPRPYRQTTVHTSAGLYTRKDGKGNLVDQLVVHGLSGGGGQLTLRNTTGNEFSHEYGHDHGLGHYPGGPALCNHSRNGAWGYHMFKHRLIANVAWNGGRVEGEIPYRFGSDAMAGGSPMGPLSVFTLYTPYSLKLMQANIAAQSGVLDPASATGYSHWDQETQCMTEFKVSTPKPDRIGVPVMTLVGVYDPDPGHALTSFIYPALYGNWGNVFLPETIRRFYPDVANSRCVLEVVDADGSTLSFPLADARLKSDRMNQFHVNLDASKTYVKATLCYGSGDSRVILDSRQLAQPDGVLPAPVIVGREAGFTQAALHLRDLGRVLVPNGYPDLKAAGRAAADYYGRILPYTPGHAVRVGHVYRCGPRLYQALSSSPAGIPERDTKDWRDLGDANTFVSTKRLPLGEQSIDYAQEVMKGKSGVYYYVPVDRDHVVASDAYSPAVRGWYAKGKVSKVTVLGAASNGHKARIVLRGQINDAFVLTRGAPVQESSRVRFSYHAEDNPELAYGDYAVSFAAYAMGWHTGRLIEAFEVYGRIHAE